MRYPFQRVKFNSLKTAIIYVAKYPVLLIDVRTNKERSLLGTKGLANSITPTPVT